VKRKIGRGKPGLGGGRSGPGERSGLGCPRWAGWQGLNGGTQLAGCAVRSLTAPLQVATKESKEAGCLGSNHRQRGSCRSHGGHPVQGVRWRALAASGEAGGNQ